MMHYCAMGRLRILAALLSCFAVFAAGLPMVAFASAPPSEAARTIGVEPCQHCPDCDSDKCPHGGASGTMACTIGCLAAPLALGVAIFTLAAVEVTKAVWPSRLAALHGLSSPPDPFPPRS
jgi:hypothetical protein